MRFNINDKIKYKGRYVNHWGTKGTIVKQCDIVAECKIVRFTNGCERHVFIKDMELVLTKNQQLVFDFMK